MKVIPVILGVLLIAGPAAASVVYQYSSEPISLTGYKGPDPAPARPSDEMMLTIIIELEDALGEGDYTDTDLAPDIEWTLTGAENVRFRDDFMLELEIGSDGSVTDWYFLGGDWNVNFGQGLGVESAPFLGGERIGYERELTLGPDFEIEAWTANSSTTGTWTITGPDDTPATVPLPASALLLLGGLGALALGRRSVR